MGEPGYVKVSPVRCRVGIAGPGQPVPRKVLASLTAAPRTAEARTGGAGSGAFWLWSGPDPPPSELAETGELAADHPFDDLQGEAVAVIDAPGGEDHADVQGGDPEAERR